MAATNMLIELDRPLQHANEAKRRIFLSDRFDLFVWVGDDGRIVAFELAYRNGAAEHAVRWKAGAGYSHHAVDDGEDSALGRHTPLLTPDGSFNRWIVSSEFRRAAAGIDPGVAAFVARKLAAYRESRG